MDDVGRCAAPVDMVMIHGYGSREDVNCRAFYIGLILLLISHELIVYRNKSGVMVKQTDNL